MQRRYSVHMCQNDGGPKAARQDGLKSPSPCTKYIERTSIACVIVGNLYNVHFFYCCMTDKTSLVMFAMTWVVISAAKSARKASTGNCACLNAHRRKGVRGGEPNSIPIIRWALRWAQMVLVRNVYYVHFGGFGYDIQ